MNDKDPQSDHAVSVLTPEARHDAAVADLIETNAQALRQLTHPEHTSRHISKELGLELIPDYMRANDKMVTDQPEARSMGGEVLAGLHHLWYGGEKTEKKVSDTYTEVYWEFQDDNFDTWTVVEGHNSNPRPSQSGLSAHMLKNKRPLEYQKLLAEEAHKLEDEIFGPEEPTIAEQSTESAKEPLAKRVGTAAVKKWEAAKEDPGTPLRYRH